MIVSTEQRASYVESGNYYSFIGNHFESEESNYAKITGKFYTHPTLCDAMAGSVISQSTSLLKKSSLSIIDPFCGDGRLVISLLTQLLACESFDLSTRIDIAIWDIDEAAMKRASSAITELLKKHNAMYSIDSYVGDAFVAFINNDKEYDICVTNPPWCILKPSNYSKTKTLKNAESDAYSLVTEEYGRFLKCNFGSAMPTKSFGRWGINLSRCGLAGCMSLLTKNGICGIVMPASFFSDQVSAQLRKELYESNSISEVCFYPAEAKLYGHADQTSITIVFEAGNRTDSFTVRCYEDAVPKKETKLDITSREYIVSNGYTIPFGYDEQAIEILNRLDSFPTLVDYPGIWIGREIDETRIHERLTENGSIAFRKGYMINRYLCSVDAEQYIDTEKCEIPATALCPKIVWRDVSRSTQKRRVKATILPKGTVAGNSLGVISLPHGNEESLFWLLAVVNSFVFEFQARRRLVTNHVPAGVVRDIRIPRTPQNKHTFEAICERVRNLLQHPSDYECEAVLECMVASEFSLSKDEFLCIVNTFDLSDEERLSIERASTMAWSDRSEPMIPNHYAAKMSDLDKMIISYVPQGGNWKNIPESVPSQRLVQIRESFKAGKGSRSTYYGRLRPDMPAYTISTYFNRPGNGCNIHYAQDRTLSQREAARLQSFPDSFRFYGSKTSINDQIGNAVPPIFAYQIASALPFKGQYVDLFCGAGGLSLGFLWAGWKPIIANDINSDAIKTHQMNIPEEALCGDITDENVINAIVSRCQEAMRQHPGMPLFVIGGPPCQGFSTANCNRSTSDQRNWLFKAYSEIVSRIKPTGFIFENVTGILNFDKGKFFEMIKQDLRKSVDEIRVSKFNCAEYGIPQRRERIIVIGSTKEVVDGFSLTPITQIPKFKTASHEPLTLTLSDGDLPYAISAKEALDDLPPITDAQEGSDLPYAYSPQNDYQRFVRGEISAEDYIARLITNH